MKVTQIDVDKDMKILDLINQFDESGVLGAGRVARACNILVDMIQDDDMSVFMSLGGPLIPGGMRNIVSKMIKEGHVDLIVASGANITPDGVKPGLKAFIKFLYFFFKDPKFALMLNEPHISDELLRSIKAKTLVLAGSRDLVTEEETRHIAETVPGAELRILKGEGHGSYIVHKAKIAEIIKEFVL